MLYRADFEPVVALIGDLPFWRTLERGVDDGDDVEQLERNLAALGYGDDIVVDRTFTAGTAEAVEAWETDLGRSDPDGVVALGDAVALSSAGDVVGHDAAIGDTVRSGAPVLTIGSERRIIDAAVDVADAPLWTAGTTVALEWADGTTAQGTVSGTGRDVAGGNVELVVTVGAGAAAGERASGAVASVTLAGARRDDAIAVPVSAVVDGDAAPAVRLVVPGGPDRIVGIETGLVAGGWVEITSGLDGGEKIRLPG